MKGSRKRRSSVRGFRHRLDVFRVLFSRDLKVMYKRSALGVGWALGMPVVQLIVFSFIFRKVLDVQIDHYPAFIFIGVLVWGWFHTAVGESVGLITSNRALVGQPGFPLVVLPNVTVAVRMFHFLVAGPLLVGMLVWNGLPPNPAWAFIPILIAVQYIFTVGLAYPLASLNVVWKDTQHVTRVGLQLLMFLSPVFYTLDLVPENSLRWYELNPMVGMLDAWRDVLMQGVMPDPLVLGKLLLLGLVLLFAGRWLFVRQSHRFLEEL